jgi:hypothetical protein
MARTNSDQLHGTLDMLVLKSLEAGSLHGYAIAWRNAAGSARNGRRQRPGVGPGSTALHAPAGRSWPLKPRAGLG